MQDNEHKKPENMGEYVKIIFIDMNGNHITSERKDKYVTTIESGYEYLNLKKDSTKINLYNTVEHIELWGEKRYKVIKRTFMPCCPVSLYLTLEEE